MKHITFIISGIFMILLTETARSQETVPAIPLHLHIVFNNVEYKAELQTSWGFSCLVEGPNASILFDTGSNGRILLKNMQHLGLDAKEVDAVVFSHIRFSQRDLLYSELRRSGACEYPTLAGIGKA